MRTGSSCGAALTHSPAGSRSTSANSELIVFRGDRAIRVAVNPNDRVVLLLDRGAIGVLDDAQRRNRLSALSENWLNTWRKAATARLSSPAARLVGGDIYYGEPFLPRSIGETVVERDHFQRGWTLFRGNEGCRELQCIGGSERVYPKKPCRRFTDHVARVDLMPAGRKLLEAD